MSDASDLSSGSTSSLPLVRVVIVNFRAAALTLRCLAALDRQTYPCDLTEIVVVDNASGDGLVETLRSTHPLLRIVANDRNDGFGAGCNAGIRLPGEHDAVALLNNDSVPEPGWLESLVAGWRRPPQTTGGRPVGAVAGKVLLAAPDSGEARDPRPPVVNSVGCELHPGGFNADRGDGQADDGSLDAPTEVFGFSGASVLIPRQALDDVGGFDEGFFLYYEDTDLVWRLRRRGWAIVTAPAAVSWHERGSSAGRGGSFWYHDTRNRLLVLARHAPLSWLLRATLVQLLLLVRGDPHGAGRRARAHALASAAVRLPQSVRARRHVDRSATVRRADVASWLVEAG